MAHNWCISLLWFIWAYKFWLFIGSDISLVSYWQMNICMMYSLFYRFLCNFECLTSLSFTFYFFKGPDSKPWALYWTVLTAGWGLCDIFRPRGAGPLYILSHNNFIFQRKPSISFLSAIQGMHFLYWFLSRKQKDCRTLPFSVAASSSETSIFRCPLPCTVTQLWDT